MTVIPFKPREKADPHLAGEAICIGCQHTWAAVAPVGTWQLECPSCHSSKGIWRNPVGGIEGDTVFTCQCGCQALVAYRRDRLFYLKCMSCGIEQTEAVFG